MYSPSTPVLLPVLVLAEELEVDAGGGEAFEGEVGSDGRHAVDGAPSTSSNLASSPRRPDGGLAGSEQQPSMAQPRVVGEESSENSDFGRWWPTMTVDMPAQVKASATTWVWWEMSRLDADVSSSASSWLSSSMLSCDVPTVSGVDPGTAGGIATMPGVPQASLPKPFMTYIFVPPPAMGVMVLEDVAVVLLLVVAAEVRVAATMEVASLLFTVEAARQEEIKSWKHVLDLGVVPAALGVAAILVVVENDEDCGGAIVTLVVGGTCRGANGGYG